MAYHDAHFTEHPARAVVWRQVARYLAPLLPRDADVIELGAAYCHWINNVQARRRVAIDLWPDLPRHAGPGVEPIVADVRDSLDRLEPSSFDVALASNLLEHFTPDEAADVARAAWRILRPGGRFILIQPNFRYAWRQYFDDYTHRAIFTDVSLPTMLRAHGFSIRLVKPRFLPYSMRESRLPMSGWLVGAYLRSPFKPAAGQMLVVAEKEASHVR